MDAQQLYDEWKSLVSESRRISIKKRELKQLLKEIRPSSKIDPGIRKGRTLDREIEMVSLYEQGKTLQEIGDTYGLTRERVRQLIGRHGIKGTDGGLTARTIVARNTACKVDDCESLATGSRGYCQFHYSRVQKYGTPMPVFKVKKFQGHDGRCLVEGCDEPFKSNGLCNKHRTGYFYNMRDAGVKDLNDYLKVQKAKRMMGKHYAPFAEIRAFMRSNEEHFEENLWTESEVPQ